MRWFATLKDGRRVGPFDVEGLNDLIRSGELREDDSLEEETTGGSTYAHAIHELEFPPVGISWFVPALCVIIPIALLYGAFILFGGALASLFGNP